MSGVKSAGPSPHGGGPAPSPQPLTDHQLRILRRIADGFTYREIAEELVMTEKGLLAAVNRLRAKLGARNVAHAVSIAYRERLLAVPSRRPVTELQPCGTPAAYRRHVRRGELVDETCRRAESERCMGYQRAAGLRPGREAA